MEVAYDELRHAISVDERFVHLALDIERHLGILDRVTKVRVKAWLAKLREQTQNLVWKKNRNMHARLLLEQLRCGKLEAPFHQMPHEGGGLPTLPQWLTCRFLSPPRSRSPPRTRSAGAADSRTSASVDMHLYRMQTSPTRSRSSSPARTGIFAWPSSPRMHSRYTALAGAASAWHEHERAVGPARPQQGAAADVYPGARSRSPVHETVAAMGGALQAELDEARYGAELLGQRLAAAEAQLQQQGRQLERARSRARSQRGKLRSALDDVISRNTSGSSRPGPPPASAELQALHCMYQLLAAVDSDSETSSRDGDARSSSQRFGGNSSSSSSRRAKPVPRPDVLSSSRDRASAAMTLEGPGPATRALDTMLQQGGRGPGSPPSLSRYSSLGEQQQQQQQQQRISSPFTEAVQLPRSGSTPPASACSSQPSSPRHVPDIQPARATSIGLHASPRSPSAPEAQAGQLLHRQLSRSLSSPLRVQVAGPSGGGSRPSSPLGSPRGASAAGTVPAALPRSPGSLNRSSSLGAWARAGADHPQQQGQQQQQQQQQLPTLERSLSSFKQETERLREQLSGGGARLRRSASLPRDLSAGGAAPRPGASAGGAPESKVQALLQELRSERSWAPDAGAPEVAAADMRCRFSLGRSRSRSGSGSAAAAAAAAAAGEGMHGALQSLQEATWQLKRQTPGLAAGTDSAAMLARLPGAHHGSAAGQEVQQMAEEHSSVGGSLSGSRGSAGGQGSGPWGHLRTAALLGSGGGSSSSRAGGLHASGAGCGPSSEGGLGLSPSRSSSKRVAFDLQQGSAPGAAAASRALERSPSGRSSLGGPGSSLWGGLSRSSSGGGGGGGGGGLRSGAAGLDSRITSAGGASTRPAAAGASREYDISNGRVIATSLVAAPPAGSGPPGAAVPGLRHPPAALSSSSSLSMGSKGLLQGSPPGLGALSTLSRAAPGSGAGLLQPSTPSAGLSRPLASFGSGSAGLGLGLGLGLSLGLGSSGGGLAAGGSLSCRPLSTTSSLSPAGGLKAASSLGSPPLLRNSSSFATGHPLSAMGPSSSLVGTSRPGALGSIRDQIASLSAGTSALRRQAGGLGSGASLRLGSMTSSGL